MGTTGLEKSLALTWDFCHNQTQFIRAQNRDLGGHYVDIKQWCIRAGVASAAFGGDICGDFEYRRRGESRYDHGVIWWRIRIGSRCPRRFHVGGEVGRKIGLEVIIDDDQCKSGIAAQLADRMIQSGKIDVLTGIHLVEPCHGCGAFSDGGVFCLSPWACTPHPRGG